MRLFSSVQILLNNGYAMTGLNPSNTIYNIDQFITTLIEVGRVMIKEDNKDALESSFKCPKVYTPYYISENFK